MLTQIGTRILSERRAKVVEAAARLYDLGLNVIPVRYARKSAFLLRPFFYGRLHKCGPGCTRAHGPTFEQIFARPVNLAVVVGHTSGNLVAIDCDTHAAYRGMRAELERHGVPFWTYTSARGGTYLMRLAEGEAANTKRPRWRQGGVEILGRLRYVVVPPSVHPSGVVYTWGIPGPDTSDGVPLVSVEALGWLGVELYRPGVAAYTRALDDAHALGLPEWTAWLSAANRRTLARALAGKIAVGERNTRLTPVVYDIAAHIIAGHIAERDALALLERAARALRYPVRHIGQMLTSALRSEPEPAKRGVSAPDIAAEFATRYDWRGAFGRAWHSTRAVYLACVQRARLDASAHDFRASERELADLAGLSRPTVHAALQRLRRAGLIEYSKPDPSGANRYRWGAVVLRAQPDGTRSDALATMPQTDAERDAFARLGRVAWLVWRHLLQQPERSKAAIARALGVSRSGVRRALERLQRVGLVEWGSAENCYYGVAASDEDLERVAALLGTDWRGHEALGTSIRRRQRHRTERELRRNLLVYQAMRRGD